MRSRPYTAFAPDILKTITALLFWYGFVSPAYADEAIGDCSTIPAAAAVTLPAPLSNFGAVICTPYGFIITNHEGWIWSNPGAYSPVFIPSQMVRNNPRALGSNSYFTKIEFPEADLQDHQTQNALDALQKGMPPEKPRAAYRLFATGSLGRSLVLYFFDFGGSMWGIWCGSDGKDCSQSTMFMVLDMNKGT